MAINTRMAFLIFPSCVICPTRFTKWCRQFFVPSLPVRAPYMCTNKLPHAGFPLTPGSDTLLNVFLAIAVDNLANAQELTKVRRSPVRHRSLSISIPPLDGFLPSHLIQSLCSLISFLSTGWAGGRGGCQSEDCPAESQGGGWSQPTVRCQPLHRSVSSCLHYRRALGFFASVFHTWQGFLGRNIRTYL